MSWYGCIGLIAATCVAIYNIPMFIKILKTKNTAGISLIMYILLVIGCWFFLIDGLGIMVVEKSLDAGLPIFLANLISGTVSTIILVVKCKNMINAKAANLSEAKYCEEKLLQTENKKKKINNYGS